MKDYFTNEAQERAIKRTEKEIQLLSTHICMQDVSLLQKFRDGEIDEIQLARAYSEQVKIMRDAWNDLTKMRNRFDFK